MPDFSAIGKLLGGAKDILDFVAGITGSLGGFGGDDSFVGLTGQLLGGSSAADAT